jgi:hypothetical protein
MDEIKLMFYWNGHELTPTPHPTEDGVLFVSGLAITLALVITLIVALVRGWTKTAWITGSVLVANFARNLWLSSTELWGMFLQLPIGTVLVTGFMAIWVLTWIYLKMLWQGKKWRREEQDEAIRAAIEEVESSGNLGDAGIATSSNLRRAGLIGRRRDV